MTWIIIYRTSYEFERILYTTHSINKEKYGYNLTFHFLILYHGMHNSYVFMTVDQKVGHGTSTSTVY